MSEFAVPAFTLPRPATSGGFVYFARCLHDDGPIKIGRAVNLMNRLGSLRNGCPYPIAYVAFFYSADPGVDEALLHERFASSRLSLRGEWFNPTEELLELVGKLQHVQANAMANLLRKTA